MGEYVLHTDTTTLMTTTYITGKEGGFVFNSEGLTGALSKVLRWPPDSAVSTY